MEAEKRRARAHTSAFTYELCPLSTLAQSWNSKSHTRMVLSSEAVMRRSPAVASARTKSLCPTILLFTCGKCAHHIWHTLTWIRHTHTLSHTLSPSPSPIHTNKTQSLMPSHGHCPPTHIPALLDPRMCTRPEVSAGPTAAHYCRRPTCRADHPPFDARTRRRHFL